MGTWEEVRRETEGSGGGGGDFLKLVDNETAVVAVLGQPESYLAKPFNPGDAPKTRVLLNVFVTGIKALKVLDLAKPTFQQLCEVMDKFPFSQRLLSIKRRGTNKNTRWTLMPDAEIDPKQKAYLASLTLPDLGVIAEGVRFKDGDERVPYPKPAEANAGGIDDRDMPFR